MSLPPFPVDDSSLDLLLGGVTIQDGAERTSLQETLDMLSMLGGSDPKNIADEGYIGNPFGPAGGDPIPYVELADQFYSVNDAIAALIAEVRRLREGGTQ
jgi:hypothetical protein